MIRRVKTIRRKREIDILKIDFDSLNISYEDRLLNILKYKSEINYENLNFAELEENYLKLKKSYKEQTLKTFLNKSFSLFDTEKIEFIDLNDLSACIYNLGLCPSLIQLKEIIAEIEKKVFKEKPKKKYRNLNQKNENKIKFSDFETTMRSVLMSGKCLSKTNNLLRQAFKLINDNSKSQIIDTNKFENVMHTIGDKFNFKEIETMKEFLNENCKNEITNQQEFDYYRYLSDLEVKNLDLELFYIDTDEKDEKKIMESYGFI